MGPQKNSKRKAAVPLAPPPHAASMKSRKRARQVTTLFHKYTREKDLAVLEGADATTLQELDDKIEAIGGRKTYQEASQLSTSFHSTSKWVLGYLQRKGWLYGIRVSETVEGENNNDEGDDKNKQGKQESSANERKESKNIKSSKKKRQRRDAYLLEIGAINTELLDASERTTEKYSVAMDATDTKVDEVHAEETTKKYRLKVRAIDIHSMHPGRIEEADFLKLPLPPTSIDDNVDDNIHNQEKRYDVIVCSMVLNCVTTPEDRGEMLTRIYHFLRPGGTAFLTIPKLCITQSPFVNRDTFVKLLGATGVGFEVENITKESPKVSFFICHRPEESSKQQQQQNHSSEIEEEQSFDTRWTRLKKIHKGRKYRNQFAVVLKKERVLATRGCGTGCGGG